MKSRSQSNKVKSSEPLVIVAMGASDGDDKALQGLLQYLPLKSGLAYLYLQSSQSETAGSNAIVGQTEMPVVEAVKGERVMPDHLYLLNPAKPLMVANGVFESMILLPESPYVDMPINQLFTTLADSYKEATIGILLSGFETDGTLGLRAIKMGGGITIVQDESATFNSMPKNAIADGVADLVFPPKEIADELNKIGKQKDVYYKALSEANEQVEEDDSNNQDEDLMAILHLLQRSISVDFTQYKINTVRRRIIRRMMLHKQVSFKDYLQYIKQHANEVSLLYQDLLINVTTFFRDKDTTGYLKETLLPRIIRTKLQNDPIRVWVPACSTGQEAYSIAMLLVEVLGDRSASTPVQIFATDLSEVAINKARLGLYSKDDVVDVSANRLERFFNKIDGHFRIVKSIRDMCVFATHNIAKDPPFSRLDMISCCNLLIYLENALQKKLMSTFHYSLLNNGFLILGKSETVGASANLFSQLEKKYKVYGKRKDAPSNVLFEMNYRLPDPDRTFGVRNRQVASKTKFSEVDLEKVVNELLLKSYIPACVVVNYDLDILQFRGATGLYLEPAPGRASLNLMKMARPGLGFELRNIVHKAKKSGAPAKKEGLEIVKDDKTTLRISIEAVPVRADVETEEQYFVVLFEQGRTVMDEGAENSKKDKRVQLLEAELTVMRDDMRSIIEAQEAANEELQSANEEIVSSNEELQSINEELETSKEEIESSNEELITINQELQMRNEQLAEVQEYSEAVFNIIREGILILDKDLRVKSANSAFYNTFKVSEEDTDGRYIYELGNGQWNIPSLRKLLHEIIPANQQFFGYEVTHTFPSIGEKIMILNARKLMQRVHGQQLILLAIEDITEHRQAQKIISDREHWFRNMADNAPVMIWVTGLNNLVSFCNKTWLEFRGVKMEEAVNNTWLEGAHPEDLVAGKALFEKAVAAKEPFTFQYRVKRFDGVYTWVLTNARPNHTPEGAYDGYIGSCVELPNALTSQGVESRE